MYNVQFLIYIVYRFSQNVQECTILLNFQIHCVQNVQNVHSSHPEYLNLRVVNISTLKMDEIKLFIFWPFRVQTSKSNITPKLFKI